jgi:ComF family protein
MLKIINQLTDLIFPPRNAEVLLRSCTAQTTKHLYQPGIHEGLHFITSYKYPLTKALITENKYYHNQKAAEHLSLLLNEWLCKHSYQPIILLPIPLNKKREKERGYNQVLEILNHLNGYKIDQHLLSRVDSHASQTTLNKNERQQNLKEAFLCDLEKIKMYEGSILIICDDVVTTGATLRAARAKLATHLPPNTKIICLALAH